jgi:hypothetical protein
VGMVKHPGPRQMRLQTSGERQGGHLVV